MYLFSKRFGMFRFAVLLAIVVFGLVPIISVIGCSKGGGGLPRETEAVCTDEDQDGFYAEAGCGTRVDLDDFDSSIYPGAPEVCADGVDNDSDGFADEGCGPGCADRDGDGFYDRDGCVTPVDCDDSDATIHPSGREICADDVDNDCDGFIDEGCVPEACDDGQDNDGDTFTDEECAFGASTVPDTGQTICYGNDERLFPCPSSGEAFYGQDACYPFAGSSYTKLDANGNPLPDSALDWEMVRDNVTGLIWEVKTDDNSYRDKDFTYDWRDAAGFVNGLNSARFGGYSDWRLPSLKELVYIVDYGAFGPAINLYYFPNTMFYQYWTSTEFVDEEEASWTLDFYDGRPNIEKRENPFYVRAVRGTRPSGQSFRDNGNNTVTDNSTGLMWMKLSAGPMTWEEALEFCEKTTFTGYTDWRLPNAKELRSLVDYEKVTPTIDLNYFPDTPDLPYWTSTTSHGERDAAWAVGFWAGRGGASKKTYGHHVRAVRDADTE